MSFLYLLYCMTKMNITLWDTNEHDIIGKEHKNKIKNM